MLSLLLLLPQRRSMPSGRLPVRNNEAGLGKSTQDEGVEGAGAGHGLLDQGGAVQADAQVAVACVQRAAAGMPGHRWAAGG